MISNSILEFVMTLIDRVVVFAGLNDFVVSDSIVSIFTSVKSVFTMGINMVSWLFPNETIYKLCVGLTIDLFTATLIFEIVALFLRIYKTVRR